MSTYRNSNISVPFRFELLRSQFTKKQIWKLIPSLSELVKDYKISLTDAFTICRMGMDPVVVASCGGSDGISDGKDDKKEEEEGEVGMIVEE